MNEITHSGQFQLFINTPFGLVGTADKGVGEAVGEVACNESDKAAVMGRTK